MEMIAAAKMKRAQNQALKGRPYIQKLTEVIADLLSLSGASLDHPFLKKRHKVNNIGYLFITSNRGLCGAFNSNVVRKMLEILREKNTTGEIVLTVGKKGRQAMERIGKAVLADFENLSDKPDYLDTIGISRVLMDDFLDGNLDEVYMVYNHFYSVMSQKPIVKQLLPITVDTVDFTVRLRRDYIFEPDKQLLLNDLLRRYVETMVYQTILESIASEHSARMVSMRQASDNAEEIVSQLTLHYNKVRQTKITTQILEVVAGS